MTMGEWWNRNRLDPEFWRRQAEVARRYGNVEYEARCLKMAEGLGS